MKYDIIDNFSKCKDVYSELKIGDLENVKEPFFSVVVPTYKRPHLLKETIQSIVNQKEFKFEYEIIVVDNEAGHEINENEKMLQELRIKNLYYYKNGENLGVCGNWNRCISLARSKWVIMCHDDDFLKHDCLQTMANIIERHKDDKKEVGYIRSSAESMYSEALQKSENRKRNRKVKLKKEKTALIQRTYWNVIWGGGATWAGAPTCGTLINKEAILKVGGYNQELVPCPDCYVPYHMLGTYGVYKTYYSLGIYRWAENDTYKKETLLGLIKAYDEFLDLLSKKNVLVKFFRKEHYADCVNYYRNKGKEANVVIYDDEIDVYNYSKIKLKLLYIIRKIHSGLQTVLTC